MEIYTKEPLPGNENLCVEYSPRRIIGTYEAHPSLTTRERSDLERQGVSPESMERVRAGYIVRTGPGSFEFEQHVAYGKPERAFLFLVNDAFGAGADVVAWMPATGWLGTWRGLAWAINQDVIYRPRLSDHKALRVCEGPLEWLRDGCRGIVLIQARLAVAFLCDAGPLLAESVEHGKQLKAALTRHPPRILVRQSVGAI